MVDLQLHSFFESLPLMAPDFKQGVVDTLSLAGAALVVALVGGFLLAIAKISPSPTLRKIAGGYIEVMRGTPALVQLFLIYFGLVAIGIKLGAFQAAVIGLGLNSAAYLAEIFRGGFLAVDRGQLEAAQAIGMRPAQSMRYIIGPQAVRAVLPPLGNSTISLLKDTSIASLIAVPDLLLRARNLTSEYFMPLPIFVATGLTYFVLCFPLACFVRYAEARWHKH
jgi:His/Glu/Gln/Arg/opine family amino acid ABC transporter permease subunit